MKEKLTQNQNLGKLTTSDEGPLKRESLNQYKSSDDDDNDDTQEML